MRAAPRSGVANLIAKSNSSVTPNLPQMSMIVALMEVNKDIVMQKMKKWNMALCRLLAVPSASPGTAKHAATEAVTMSVEITLSDSTLSLNRSDPETLFGAILTECGAFAPADFNATHVSDCKFKHLCIKNKAQDNKNKDAPMQLKVIVKLYFYLFGMY